MSSIATSTSISGKIANIQNNIGRTQSTAFEEERERFPAAKAAPGTFSMEIST